MADKKITDLREVISPKITDYLPIVNNDETKKVTLDNFVAQSTYSLAKVNNLITQNVLNPTDNLPLVTSSGNIRKIPGSIFATQNQLGPITAFANTSATFIRQTGNSLGQNINIGTNDNFSLAVKTNNITRITISNNGNTGIGVTDPSNTLDIGGGLFIRGVATNNNIFTTPGQVAIKGNADNDPFITFHSQDGTRQGFVQFGDTFTRLQSLRSGDFYIGTNSNDNLTINTNGNISISNNLTVAGLNASSLLATNSQKQLVSVPSTESVLFVPINFSTRSNAIPSIVYWTANGNTSSSPWWSGEQNVTLNNVPSKAVAVLVQFFANSNPVVNNGQRVLAYSASEASSVGRPSSSTAPQNITIAQRNAINNAFDKVVIDPTGGSGASFEGEHATVIPVYFDTITKQFKWFWLDTRNQATPTSAPYYQLEIKTLGYFVTA
jgi:hypothetical protein